MTLQQLKYFTVACRYRNISRAAEECGVSQPSVSAAIKNLEEEFGICLVRRRQTGFSLTEEGQDFRRLAESLLEHAKNVQDTMSARGKNRSLIRLGVPPMVASVLFPAIYGSFCASNPEVVLSTYEMGRDELLKALDDDRLDLAFLPHAEPFSSNYKSIPIACFETVCCVAKGHPLSKRDALSPLDLAKEPLVLFADGFFQNERVLSRFAEAEIEPRILHRFSQLSTVEQFICENLAVGFLFREAAEKNDGLDFVSLTPRLDTEVSLVFRNDRFVGEGMRKFIGFVEKAFTKR